MVKIMSLSVEDKSVVEKTSLSDKINEKEEKTTQPRTKTKPKSKSKLRKMYQQKEQTRCMEQMFQNLEDNSKLVKELTEVEAEEESIPGPLSLSEEIRVRKHLDKMLRAGIQAQLKGLPRLVKFSSSC